jgi:transposase
LEERRRKAIGMLQEDLPLREIARKVGCHASSVLRWRDAWRRGGDAALKAKPVPGRPPRLTLEQKRRLVAFLEQRGAVRSTRRQPWTARQVAAWIERRFGVKYHPNHVAKLLHRLGWNRHKPGN